MADKSILFIFDADVNTFKAARLITRYGVRQIDIFPLTGDLWIIQKIESCFLEQGLENIFIYDTSTIVDEQLALLRNAINKWSNGIGEEKVGKKSIKEWFFLPGCNISTWWFSLFAEKNPFKTDVFLKISQVHALEYSLKKKKYDLIILISGRKDLRSAIKNSAGKLSKLIMIPRLIQKDGLKWRLKDYLKNSPFYLQIWGGFKFFFYFLRHKALAKLYLPAFKKRLYKFNPLLFVTFFPLIEKAPAQNGIFRNRYALPLQEKLKAAGLPITWILFYVPMDGFSFMNAVAMAKRFVDKGERLFFIEEFLTLKDSLWGLFLWLRQIFIGLFLFSFIRKALVSAPVGKGPLPFMKSLWSRSFYGRIGLEGIFLSLTYRKVFKEITNVNDCLYYFEMQPWEHALNAAKNQENPHIRSIGFQHSCIPRNWFSYLYEQPKNPRDVNYTELPLPDIIAANGKSTQDLLLQSGYPAVTRLEALRYLHFDEILSSPIDSSKERRTLLVAGSGDKDESIRLIQLISFVFPRTESFDICFKGHPSFPFEKLFKELGIDIEKSGYTVNHDDISVSLKEAFAVITLSSTVVIESLAFGCEVIVPVFPDFISMHPLVGFERYYHKACKKAELIKAVEEILNGQKLCTIQEYRNFVREYWDIDRNIPRWLKLLNVNTSAVSENSNIVLHRR